MLRIFEENFDLFLGLGFAASPTPGQLDSNLFSASGLSDGAVGFGETATSGDFARGQDDDGGVSTGGIYAFTVGGDTFLGFQPAGSDLTPGAITVRAENTTGADQTEFTISFDLLINNDQARANSLDVLVSTDGVNFSPIDGLSFTSNAASDASGFQRTAQTATFTVDPVVTGGFLFIQFATDDVSGSGSRDEFGLDNITIDALGDGAPTAPALVINEVLFDPAAGDDGDANGDGVRDAANDEFIEIVNTGASDIDISGFTLSDDDGGNPFTFAEGTILAAGQALVLFGGGAPTGDFGDALIFIDDGSIGTGLANGGDTVELRDNNGDLVTSFTYAGGDANDESLTRDPDLTGDFAAHSGAAGSGGALFSPGTLINGDPFLEAPAPEPYPVSIVINEVHFDPAAGDAGDANGDGVREAAGDEFVEIINTGLESADLSGFTLSDDDGGNPFTFAPGTILESGQALVLFGGGTPTGDFGGALVFVDDGSIGTGLANGGDTVELRDTNGDLVVSFTYAGGDANDESLTRDPDFTGDFVEHSTATGSGGALFSPGTQLDGTAFGDLPLRDISINELRISAPGSDDALNYVELFGAANTSLDGLTLVVLSGEFEPGQVDFAFDLTGLTIDDDGLLLIANGDLTTNIPQALIEANDLIADFDFFGSPSTFLLVENFTGAQGDDLDTNNDGELDGNFFDAVLDSISLVDDDATPDFSFSETIVGPDGSFPPAHVFRTPDGDGPFQVGDFSDFSDDTPGTVNTPPFADARIFEIQGASHISPLEGQGVRTSGIVTAVAFNGFYLQDPEGDGDFATSDGIFVFTGGAPSVLVGDDVTVEGVVDEFIPGGAGTDNLSITEIVDIASVTVNSSGNALPDAILIGADGILPPSEIIISESETPANLRNPDEITFNPETDGIDFYEALEGQLVTIAQPQVVGETNGFGEIFVVADRGAGATGLNERGGLNQSANDANPERIQIDDSLFDGFAPGVSIGDVLDDVTGVVSYSFGNFEVLPTVAPSVIEANEFAPEVTALQTGGGALSIASFNVLNLDPNDADGDADVASGRFAAIAEQIVNNLATPDIVSLQEVQDGNGSDTGELSAEATLQALIDAIEAAGGPTYEFFEIAPDAEFTTGGQPGGNIRNAFLYNPTRVSLDAENSFLLDETTLAPLGVDVTTFDGTRRPLVGSFNFAGHTVTVVNNHFTSLGGSQPLFGAFQPPEVGGADRRFEQATAVNAFVDALLAEDANAQIVVTGDLNDFEFSPTLDVIAGEEAEQVLFNQVLDIDPSEDRFSFIFQGNANQLDHFLVTSALDPLTDFDILQTNVGDFNAIASDHNPILGNITFFTSVIAGTEERDRRLEGTEIADFIEGLGGDDRILAQAGDDFVDAGDGNDLVIAAQGDDVVNGGQGNDRLFGGIGNDDLSGGIGNDRLDGEAGDDTLRDGAGDDTVNGGSGNDLFVLGAGSDSLLGGRDQDVFQAEAGFEADTIRDFAIDEDQLDLRAFGIDSAADALATAQQIGSSTVFDFGSGDVLTLSRVALTELTDANFVNGGAPDPVADPAAALLAALGTDLDTGLPDQFAQFIEDGTPPLSISTFEDLWIL